MIDRNCVICSTAFQARRPSDVRQTCSAKCRTRFQAQRCGRTIWSEAELSHLRDRLNTRSTTQIYRSLKSKAEKEGTPIRTPKAVGAKLRLIAAEERSNTTKPTIDNWTMKGLARVLQVPRFRIERWKSKGLIVRKCKTRFHVSRVNLKAFAKGNPLEFSGISKDLLLFVLDDPELAQDVFDNSLDTVQLRPPKRVASIEQNPDTGEKKVTLYESCMVAAELHEKSTRAIYDAIKNWRFSAGKHWKWADDLND